MLVEVHLCISEDLMVTTGASALATKTAMTKFFDDHDMGDALEKMPEAYFAIANERRTDLVAIDEEIAGKLDDCSLARNGRT